MNTVTKKFNDIKLGFKLTVLGLLLLIPTAMLIQSFVSSTNDGIQTAQFQQVGIQVIEPLYELQLAIKQHLSLAKLYEVDDLQEYLDQQNQLSEKEIATSFETLTSLAQGAAGDMKISESLTNMQAQWKAINEKTGVSSATELNEQYQALLVNLLSLYEVVAQDSKLAVDPDLHTNYLVRLLVDVLPNILQDFSAGSEIVLSAVEYGFVTPEKNIEIAIVIDSINQKISQINNNLSTVYASDPTGALQPAIEPLATTLITNLQTVEGLMRTEVLNQDFIEMNSEYFQEEVTNSYTAIVALSLEIRETMVELKSARIAELESQQFTGIMRVVAFTAVALVIGFLLVTGLTRRVNSVVKACDGVANGRYDNTFDAMAEDEVGQIQSSILAMQQSLKDNVENIEKIANEGTRIRQALDGVATGVLLLDVEGNVFYQNDACKTMLKVHESALKEISGKFNADQLLGAHFSLLYSGSSIIKSLKTTHKDTLSNDSVHLDFVISPTKTEEGEVIGFGVEWEDRTEKSKLEAQVSDLVSQAAQGDLSGRMEVDTCDPFFKALSHSLNDLLKITEGVIENVQRVLSALAKGDLTESIDANYAGSFGQLKDDANTTVNQLSTIISDLINNAMQVSAGVREIAQGNLDLSARTEKQASALEETAASMEEMTSTVVQNKERAMEASDKSAQTQEKSLQGKQVVDDAVVAMSNIDKASQKIVEIISVIDEIAFQTNLLALNAAVEAARAGDQGRGFAVVASEVRTLAQRSAEAAKEIKALIQDSVDKVKEGTRLVNSSGSALDEITSYAEQVSQMMSQLSDATREQSEGIGQVNAAITEMDVGTQQNAALVEQTTATSGNMADIAAELIRQMEFFTLSTVVGSGLSSSNVVAKSGSPTSAPSPVMASTASTVRGSGQSATPSSVPTLSASSSAAGLANEPGASSATGFESTKAPEPPKSQTIVSPLSNFNDDDEEWEEF